MTRAAKWQIILNISIDKGAQKIGKTEAPWIARYSIVLSLQLKTVSINTEVRYLRTLLGKYEEHYLCSQALLYA